MYYINVLASTNIDLKSYIGIASKANLTLKITIIFNYNYII